MGLIRSLTIVLIFLASCRQEVDLSNRNMLMARLPKDPAAAIHVLDSLLDQNGTTASSDRRALLLRSIRQESFARLAQMDSVLEEAIRIQQIARRLDDSVAYASSLLPLRGEVDEAKFKYLENSFPLSIGIFSRRERYREQAMLMATHASMLGNLGRFDESQSQAMAAIVLPGSASRDSLRAYLYLTIANNYMGYNTHDKAFQYFRQALHLAGSLRDSVILPGILQDMGILHYTIGTDSASHYYQKALDAIPAEGGNLIRMKIMYNLSVEDFEAKRNKEALAGFRNLLSMSQTKGLLMGQGVAYKALGFFYEANARPDSAVFYLKRAIEMADSIKQPFLKIQSLIELEKAYRTLGDAEMAFRQHKVTDRIKDSMFTIGKESVIHGLEMHFDTERKELENLTLRKNLTIRKGGLTLALVLCLFLLFFLWMQNRRNLLLSERNASYAVLMAWYKAERIAHPQKPSDTPSTELPFESHGRQARKTPVTTPQDPQPDTIYVELQHLFKMKALYKDPKLRIEDLAQMLNVSVRQISNVLKEREDLNYRQYVNRYRILEARRIMEDPANDILKLEAIGEMSGFTSRSHFQKVFESVSGVTPGFYRRNILSETETELHVETA